MFKICRIALPMLFFALVLTGCRSHKEAVRTTPPVDTIVPVSPVTPPPSRVTPQYYSANFTCSAQGMTVNGQLRMEQDSVLWASATKVIELGRAMLTPDSVIVYAKVIGRCFRGSYIDLYRRFHYRTSFEEISEMLMADDAEKQIVALARRFGIEATVSLDPWKKVPTLTFPMTIPNHVKPL